MATKKKVTLTTDISDWDAAWRKIQREHGIKRIDTEDEALAMQEELGMATIEAVPVMVAARESEEAAQDLLQSNKIAIALGHAQYWHRRIARRRVKVEMPSGDQRMVREIVCSTIDERAEVEDEKELDAEVEPVEGESWKKMAHVGSQLALDRAERYLMGSSIGTVRGRFEQIAATDPQRLKGVAQAYIDRVKQEYELIAGKNGL
jgi:hypothetical protein